MVRRRPTVGARPHRILNRPPIGAYHRLDDPRIVLSFLLLTSQVPTALPLSTLARGIEYLCGLKLAKSSIAELVKRYSFTH